MLFLYFYLYLFFILALKAAVLSCSGKDMQHLFFPTDPEPVACFIVPLSGNAGNLKLCWCESECDRA